MSKALSIIVTTLLYSTAAAYALKGVQEPLSGLTAPQHTFRPAVEDDLDDVVTVYIDAFKPSAAWEYSHLSDDRYANYTWTCMRKRLQEEWDNRHNISFANVISVPQEKRSDTQRDERVVSFAAWSWKTPGEQTWPLSALRLHTLAAKCSENLDMNLTRAADLERQIVLAEDRYVHNVTEPQLYLGLLATHPHWDGNGFGAEQVRYGIREAADASVPITLLASPAGYPLYDSLGFSSLANVTFRRLDDLGVLWLEYMRWEHEGHA